MPDFAPSTAQRRPVVALTGPWNSLYDTCMPSLASMSDASSESGASTPVAPAHVPGNAGRLEPEFARTGPSSPAPGRALQRVPCSHPAMESHATGDEGVGGDHDKCSDKQIVDRWNSYSPRGVQSVWSADGPCAAWPAPD